MSFFFNTLRARRLSALLTAGLAAALLAGCGEEGGGGSGRGDGDGQTAAELLASGDAPACTTSADCDAGWVCLEIAGTMGCAPTCEGQADECGASGSCGGVGATAVNICKEEATAESPPEPEEEPKLPCAVDADCEALQAGTICVQFQGVKECTIPCAGDAGCDLPGAPGIEIDLLACAVDEADGSRQGCVPDLECFEDISRCVSVEGVEIPGAGVPGADDGQDPGAGLPGGVPGF